MGDPQGDVNQWRPGFIQSLDAGGFTGGLGFYLNGAGSSAKFGSNEVMRLVNGNVGIGITNPSARLHVAGTILATSFSGNGAGLTNLDATTLGGSNSSGFWQSGGNVGTTAGVNFVGTADNQALELKVNGTRAFRLEPNNFGSPSVIGGSPNNFVSGRIGATIAGGGIERHL